MIKRTLFVLSALLTLGILVGCRQNTIPPSEATVDVTLSIAPNPPVVGPATLVVTVTDSDGDPINDAQVAVRGDMDHAGMQPVVEETSTAQDGDYTLPFEWTMSGDWFVIVTVTLVDGTVIEEQFDFQVTGDISEVDEMEEMEIDETEESGS